MVALLLGYPRFIILRGLADLAGVRLTQVQRYEAGTAQPMLNWVRIFPATSGIYYILQWVRV